MDRTSSFWILLALVAHSQIGCGGDAAPTSSAPVATVDVVPDVTTVGVGQVKQLAAVAKDTNGRELTGRTTSWTSSNAGVATVDGQGLLRGVAVGSARIFAEVEGKRDSALVTVTATTTAGMETVFSTYLGGQDEEVIRDVATDAQGNVYVTGGTVSPNFPTTAGAFQRTHNPGTPEASGITRYDVFVTKLDPTGRIVWSTLLGGPNYDRAYAIEVDAQGFVYVGGRAGRGFPVTTGAFQTTFQGGQEAPFYGPQDGFVCKIRPDGTALVFCSYFGTSDFSIIRDLAVDPIGDIYIASARASGTFQASISSVFTNQPKGGEDAVMAKIRSNGTAVLWATYLGGSSIDTNQNSVRVDGVGNPYMLLTTRSSDAPTTAGAFQRNYRGEDELYVARLNPGTGAIVWATYLGGSSGESTETHEFAVDAAGNAYVAAATGSADFPLSPGAFQSRLGGAHDIFVAKISADGARLLGSTFIGGINGDRPEGVTVDALGNVYLTGTTTSPNFPVTADAFQVQLRGGRDAIAVQVAPDFTRLVYSTYFGGSGDEYGRGVAFAQGSFYFGGETTSRDWPITSAAQTSFGGGNTDALLVRLRPR